MSEAAPPVGYASGLYTDFRSRLVFYAAFESQGGLVVAALATEGAMRTVGGMLRLETTQLSELPSMASMAATIVVDADARPAGRRKQRMSLSAAKALGFVRSESGDDVLPTSLRCARWHEFRQRAGAGLFAAWSREILAVAPDLPAGSQILDACDRILTRWPGAARMLAERAEALPQFVVDATDDELPAAVAEHVLSPCDRRDWSRGAAACFLASHEGEALVDLADAVDLAGRLPTALHPNHPEDLQGFAAVAVLLAELRLRSALPTTLPTFLMSFAADWSGVCDRHALLAPGGVEAAADLVESHLATMARRYGVPAWLELTLPHFRDMSARAADSLVLAVLLALREQDGLGAALPEVLLSDIDLDRLLTALRVSGGSSQIRFAHVADVETNFRDAENAGELLERLPARFGGGGSRRIGIELVDAGFGEGVDLVDLRCGIEGPSERPATPIAQGIPVLLYPSARQPRPQQPRGRSLAWAAAVGVILAIGIAMANDPEVVLPSTLSPAAQARVQARMQAEAETERSLLADLAARRTDLAAQARLNPAPCPPNAGPDRVCGRFGDLILAIGDRSWPKPALAGYVVEGRHPVEVFSWSTGLYRNPSAVWAKHLLQNLDESPTTSVTAAATDDATR